MPKRTDMKSQLSGKRAVTYGYSATVLKPRPSEGATKAMFSKAALDRGLRVVAEYDDEGGSREGLQRLLDRATSGESFCEYLLVQDLSRFGRNPVALRKIVNTFHSCGIEIISTSDNTMMSDWASMERQMIKVWAGEQHADRSRRIQRALADKRRQAQDASNVQQRKIKCDVCAGRGYHLVETLGNP